MTWGLTFKAINSTQIYIQMYFTQPILTVHLQYWKLFIPPLARTRTYLMEASCGGGGEGSDSVRPFVCPDDARLDDGEAVLPLFLYGQTRHYGQKQGASTEERAKWGALDSGKTSMARVDTSSFENVHVAGRSVIVER